jgi:ParB-like chromosome segregation protein Spo0J
MQRPISELNTRPPFAGLFPIRSATLTAITASMQKRGFDPSKPIDVWEGQDVVLDGHTRLRAATAAGLPTVEVYEHEFADEAEALEYAIRNQRDRRNLTDPEILSCIAALDQRGASGTRTDLASIDARSGKSAARTAALVGTSPAKVERVRTVLDHGAPETQEAVRAGEKSIHAAYQETQERRAATGQRQAAFIHLLDGKTAQCWAKALYELAKRTRYLQKAGGLEGRLRGLKPHQQQQLLRDIRTVEGQLEEIATAIGGNLPHDDQH